MCFLWPGEQWETRGGLPGCIAVPGVNTVARRTSPALYWDDIITVLRSPLI